jgi:hypothetical protein
MSTRWLARNTFRRSHCAVPRLGPCTCLRLLTARAMLRNGADAASVAARTGVPQRSVYLILAVDLARHSSGRGYL